MTFHLHQNDIPEGLIFKKSVAVDTETMGLNFHRDRLCVVQLSGGDGIVHLVQFKVDKGYDAPRLKALLENSSVLKIFHFARFDVSMLNKHLGVTVSPVYCTKIASRLTRTSTDKHGLKDLLKDLVGVEISKQQQTSDWGASTLSEAQIAYAASDVLHLHALKARLDELLIREKRVELAQSCFDFLPARGALDLLGWDGEKDIFNH